MKRKNRLNPSAVLDRILAGVQPDRGVIAEIRAQLNDPCSVYDKAELIKILSRADGRQSVPDIRQEFLTGTDPFVVHAALIALFRWWSEDPSDPQYLDRVRSLARGMEWDADRLVVEAAKKL